MSPAFDDLAMPVLGTSINLTAAVIAFSDAGNTGITNRDRRGQ